MKTKISMMLMLVFALSFAASAQMQRMSIEDRVKMTMEKLTPLNLNADQQQKTQTAFTDYYKSTQKIMQDARDKGERPDRSVFQKAADDRDAALKNIFTEDQYKKFKDEVEATLRPQRRTNQ